MMKRTLWWLRKAKCDWNGHDMRITNVTKYSEIMDMIDITAECRKKCGHTALVTVRNVMSSCTFKYKEYQYESCLVCRNCKGFADRHHSIDTKCQEFWSDYMEALVRR